MMFSICFSNRVQLIANSNSAKWKLFSYLWEIQSTEIVQWPNRGPRWPKWLEKLGDLKLRRRPPAWFIPAPSETATSGLSRGTNWRNTLIQSTQRPFTAVISVTTGQPPDNTWNFTRKVSMMDGSTVVQYVSWDLTRKVASSLTIEEITTKIQFISCTIYEAMSLPFCSLLDNIRYNNVKRKIQKARGKVPVNLSPVVCDW